MARIKFGNVVVDMRGKISGNVYSKNKGGAYSRVRVVPVNPRSAAQSAVRAIFTVLSQAWKGLSDPERQSWRAAVGGFPVKNSLGDSHNLSGNALYVALNKNLADVNLPAMAEAPTPQPVDTVEVLTAVADNSSQSLVITLAAVLPADTSLKIFLSNAVSAGVASIGSKMRQIDYRNSGDAALMTLTTEYLAKFGTIGQVGDKMFYELVPVSEVSGQLGASIRGVITIEA